jgi:hypothetical protein
MYSAPASLLEAQKSISRSLHFWQSARPCYLSCKMSNTDHLLYHRVELGVNEEELSDSSIFSSHSEDEIKEEEVCCSTRTKSNRNLRFSIISLSCIVLSALSLGLIVGVGISNRSGTYAVLRDCTERLSVFCKPSRHLFAP